MGSIAGHLRERLEAAGVDPDAFGDPAAAWRRLHERFGQRITLIDRYALEAAHRGIPPEALSREQRAGLFREILSARYPGLEFTPASGRTVVDLVDVVDHRATWAQEYGRWEERLAESMGAAALRIEHVGSTAVAGLPAKAIVDVQVSVRDVEDEDAYVAAIASTGVPLRSREPGHRYFRPVGDQPRNVQIHVCEAGSAWERDHLLFRDYLRAEPGVRDAYAQLKAELARRYRDDRLAYTEGKTGFILDALDEARGWAERTGWQVPHNAPALARLVRDVP